MLLYSRKLRVVGEGYRPTTYQRQTRKYNLKTEMGIQKPFLCNYFIYIFIAYKSFMDFAIKVNGGAISRLRTFLLTSPMDPIPVVAAKWIT